MDAPHLLCLGLGYTAQALARRGRALGWRVRGTCRPGPQEGALRAQGWEVLPCGQGAALPPDALEGVTHLLDSIPPEGSLLEQVRPLLAGAERLRWVGYLSATSVYGDQGGAWVEAGTTPCRPTGGRGQTRLAAEQAWQALLPAVPVHVFRLAGIYGPGRSALDRVRAGEARRVAKPGLVFSRIHVEDAATALLASCLSPRPGAIYDLADDEPAPPEDVVTCACELLGVTPPPLELWSEARLSPPLREFYADSKRVSNRRAKEELGWRPAWPDYRAGLRALLAGE